MPQSLGPDGKPRPELLVADGLHLTPEGYKVWTAALKPYLTQVTGCDRSSPVVPPLLRRT